MEDIRLQPKNVKNAPFTTKTSAENVSNLNSGFHPNKLKKIVVSW